jgi:hypothetical protein
MELGNAWCRRFAIHYLCFYDMGGAVAAAEQTTEADFWSYVLDNYVAFPRGTERRHSRGELGLRYVTNLSKLGTPRDIWRAMHAPNYTTLVKVFTTQFKNCGFGPYFIWKVMDFQDRIFENPVSLSLVEAVTHCPNEPRKCADTVWPGRGFLWCIDEIAQYIKQWVAPGAPDRMCSLPEAETLLCMMKGWGITKTHTIGDDVDLKYEQLRKWPQFLKFLPPKQDWSQYVRPDTMDAASLSGSIPSLDN